MVRDAAQAIEIGKPVCDNARQDADWQAEPHDGIWQVWLGDRDCHAFSAKVVAANGKIAGPCMLCVIVE
ncbi:MAG TPA: hypothetical protein VG889_02850 [Rhizomicrobium sp.]|nr:hypothetical protein [Rhizomicrobium sp.]